MNLKNWNKTSQKLMKKQRKMKLIRKNNRKLQKTKKQRKEVYSHNLKY